MSISMKLLKLSGLVIAFIFNSTVFAQSFESLEKIRNSAKLFAISQIKPIINKNHTLNAEVGRLDPRLRLPICDQALQAFLPTSNIHVQHISVGVKCPAKKTWTLYVPVRIEVYGDVVVASGELPRGSLTTANNLHLARQKLSSLQSNFYTDVESIIGKELVRRVSTGKAITQGMLRDPIIIRRGEQVVLHATRRGLEVRMSGKALNNGIAGERIQVRAIGSKRVVEGVILAPGIVAVTL